MLPSTLSLVYSLLVLKNGLLVYTLNVESSGRLLTITGNTVLATVTRFLSLLSKTTIYSSFSPLLYNNINIRLLGMVPQKA